VVGDSAGAAEKLIQRRAVQACFGDQGGKQDKLDLEDDARVNVANVLLDEDRLDEPFR
jgi:hypothetical protein